MKYVLLLAAVVATLFISTTQKENESFEPVAVVELFTSQGCSSCPAADRLLTKTLDASRSKGQKVIALSFHVDYWNRLGWADPFSDKAYTKRQSQYARAFGLSSMYTPQMVVNGKKQFVGSNETNLKTALSQASRQNAEACFTQLSATMGNNNLVKVDYVLAGKYQDSKVNFALVSDRETTAIKRGENGGRTLSSDNVVRQFLTIAPNASGEVLFNPMPIDANHMTVLAYIQQTENYEIIGAARTEIK